MLDPRSIAQIAEKTSATIVTATALGSGVFISERLLLTNAHVVGNNKQVRWRQEGQSSERIGTVIAHNAHTDLA